MLLRDLAVLLLLVCAPLGCVEEDLPEVRGVSRYVEMVGWTDFTPCGATLPEQDRFIEAVFQELGEPAPSERFVQYLWFTSLDQSEHPDYWPCDGTTRGCAFDKEPLAQIASLDIEHRHELVHAVHYVALGPSHSLLYEGLASYYGDPFLDLNLDSATFEAGLEDILESAEESPVDDYAVARRFVGATIERHGMTLFKQFWASTSPGASRDEFREAYESTYPETLAGAIEAARDHSTTPMPLDLCREEPRPWMTDELFEIEFRGKCGDANSYGPLDVDPTLFEQRFVVEFPESGYYQIEAVGSSLEGTALVGSSCASVAQPQTISVSADTPAIMEVLAGRYLMSAGLLERMGGDSMRVRITPYPGP